MKIESPNNIPPKTATDHSARQLYFQTTELIDQIQTRGTRIMAVGDYLFIVDRKTMVDIRNANQLNAYLQSRKLIPADKQLSYDGRLTLVTICDQTAAHLEGRLLQLGEVVAYRSLVRDLYDQTKVLTTMRQLRKRLGEDLMPDLTVPCTQDATWVKTLLSNLEALAHELTLFTSPTPDPQLTILESLAA